MRVEHCQFSRLISDLKCAGLGRKNLMLWLYVLAKDLYLNPLMFSFDSSSSLKVSETFSGIRFQIDVCKVGHSSVVSSSCNSTHSGYNPSAPFIRPFTGVITPFNNYVLLAHLVFSCWFQNRTWYFLPILSGNESSFDLRMVFSK